MGLANDPHERRIRQRKKRWWVLGKLLVWFEGLNDQKGVGPFITLSSVGAAFIGIIFAGYNIEIDDLTKQWSESRTKYEGILDEMQNEIEERIPLTVRNPLPIFPKNEISLIFRPTTVGEKEVMDLELEWVDRDRKHHHKYLVQVVCIAKIRDVKPSEYSQVKRDMELDCGSHKLDADHSDVTKLDRETVHLTQPGADSIKVPINHEGTYAWRVARVDTDGYGNITIFQDWSPYFIFTVFKSIQSRVTVMNEVLVGVVEGSVLELKIDGAKEDNNLAKIEENLVNSIQVNYFKDFLRDKDEQKNEKKRYLQYPTYEALIEGVARGEVDYAIGEITRAKYREKLGVFFTRGYADGLPIFISRSSSSRPPGDGDTIGVISGSVNERALVHLVAKPIKFTIVRELLLRDLERGLQKGILNFIFSSDGHIKDLIHLRESNRPNKYFSGGTLYSDLKDFYAGELGYSPMYAIATADEATCKELDKQIKLDPKGHPMDGINQRLRRIYREERETFFSFSLYLRIIHVFIGDGEPCGKK